MSLKPLIESTEIQFVFVGGKGGVGKTTCSCSIAIQFAQARRGQNILLISTDPAHNLSDAFGQQFGGTPTRVEGVDNLFAMETDPTAVLEKEVKDTTQGLQVDLVRDFRSWISSVPGIDEAMALAAVLQHVESGEFSMIIFDTAPTGHTLRLLQLPAVLQVGLDKLTSWKARLSGVLSSVSSLLYAEEDGEQAAMRKLEEKMTEYKAAVTTIGQIFKDTKRTEFVCVCIAEHLSVYETRRLVGELDAAGIASKYVLVNQLMPRALASVTPESGGAQAVAKALDSCGAGTAVAKAVREAVELCAARARIQGKYLKDLTTALEKTHTAVCLPLLAGEVRGVSSIRSFSERMMSPSLSLKMGESQQGAESIFAGLDEKLLRAPAYKPDIKPRFFSAEGGEEETPTPAALQKGTRVVIEGLRAKPEYNGRAGVILSGPDPSSRRYCVSVANKKVKLKRANIRPASDEENPTKRKKKKSSALSPELIQMVQGMLMQPGGIGKLLKHKEVIALRQNDPSMEPFFKDIETKGIMGALPYLSNNDVIQKMGAVARKIQAGGK